MPQIGPLEILVVAVVALIVFGPEKLPEIARSLGKAASELRRVVGEARTEFESGLHDDADDATDETDESGESGESGTTEESRRGESEGRG
jgi:sec-independent protein translocase protein TatB